MHEPPRGTYRTAICAILRAAYDPVHGIRRDFAESLPCDYSMTDPASWSWTTRPLHANGARKLIAGTSSGLRDTSVSFKRPPPPDRRL